MYQSTIYRPNGKLSAPMRLVTMKPTSVIIMDTHPIIRMSIEVSLQKQWIADCPENGWLPHNHRLSPNPSCWFNHYGYRLARNRRFYLPEKDQTNPEHSESVILSSKSECFYAGRAIQAGANGFVSKCNDQNDIFHAVQMILSGYTFFPSETLNYIKSNKCSTNSSTVTVLSNREVTILRYLVSGLSNKEIADKLLLSNKTVSAHKSNIYGKLGLHSIVELIDYAKLYELI